MAGPGCGRTGRVDGSVRGGYRCFGRPTLDSSAIGPASTADGHQFGHLSGVRLCAGRRRGGGGRFDLGRPLGQPCWALQSGDSLRGESVVTGALHHRSGPQSAAVATCLLDGGF
uniref:Uncharacterized protein n=1 Tax=Macrostomum lignano TaxID=282301 RepID=A0A1I8II77_9PLAT